MFINGFGHFRTTSDRIIVVYAALMSLYVTKTVFEVAVTSTNVYIGVGHAIVEARKSRWRGTRAPAKPHHTTWFGMGCSSLNNSGYSTALAIRSARESRVTPHNQ